MDPVQAHDSIVQELQDKTQAVGLVHVSEDQVRDRSSPVVEPGTHLKPAVARSDLLNEINVGVPLRHSDSGAQDRSAPVIDPAIHIQPNHHKDLLGEISTAGSHSAVVHAIKAGAADIGTLHHVETVDKSAPIIEPGTHLSTWDKDGLLGEIVHHAPLKHVEHVEDRSAPVVEAGVAIKPSHHGELLEELQHRPADLLRHVEPAEVHDASVPVVQKTASMRIRSSDDGSAPAP